MVTSKTRSRGAQRLTALAVAAVAVSAIAVAGCGGNSYVHGIRAWRRRGVSCRRPVRLYFEITTDLEGQQWPQVGKLAAALPGLPEASK